MTLLIACLIIFQFEMNQWLYAVSALVWLGSVGTHALYHWHQFNLLAMDVLRAVSAVHDKLSK